MGTPAKQAIRHMVTAGDGIDIKASQVFWIHDIDRSAEGVKEKVYCMQWTLSNSPTGHKLPICKTQSEIAKVLRKDGYRERAES